MIAVYQRPCSAMMIADASLRAAISASICFAAKSAANMKEGAPWIWVGSFRGSYIAARFHGSVALARLQPICSWAFGSKCKITREAPRPTNLDQCDERGLAVLRSRAAD